MTVINIRGASGSGKSTLVHRYLSEHTHEPIMATLSDWKKPKIVAYKCFPKINEALPDEKKWLHNNITYVIGRYETQCGGCDTMSYKGSHEDIETMVRAALMKGNVIFEGLTISSTLTRWQRISDEYPGQYVWAFMDTPVEECHQRILARNGGREPKVDSKGKADYHRKYEGCMRHIKALEEKNERVLLLSSDDEGYAKLVEVLDT